MSEQRGFLRYRGVRKGTYFCIVEIRKTTEENLFKTIKFNNN